MGGNKIYLQLYKKDESTTGVPFVLSERGRGDGWDNSSTTGDSVCVLFITIIFLGKNSGRKVFRPKQQLTSHQVVSLPGSKPRCIRWERGRHTERQLTLLFN